MFYDDTGASSPYPFSREMAKRKHYKKYTYYKPCPECGGRERYVKNDKCVLCAEYDAADFFYYVTGVMSFNIIGPLSTHYPPDAKIFNRPPDREIPVSHRENIEKHADMVRVPRMIARFAEDAIRMGLRHYTAPFPCEAAGHIGVMTLNGDCYFCEQERNNPSPRQAAKLAGEAWYMPTEGCKWCGKMALRRVANGECKGCLEDAPGVDLRRSETSIMMENAPDMVISREDARRLGLKVFRTGAPCRRGHTGFRWVSTGGCLACLKGER